ncbi:amidohydrolase [Labedella populi]|uniref:Amidohydrolase n=1 Tax=Labedella populi TaxID=2498850 RepID=A0A3S4E679_9MICO|nr:Atu4866 domain-containing protein [Labedella populi]RWZ64269.1 amidohydrolase [Labedella populi]
MIRSEKTTEQRAGLVVTGGVVAMSVDGRDAAWRWERRDLVVVADRIVSATFPVEGAEVIRAEGAFVVPLQVESALRQGGRARAIEARLEPANPATFAVVRRRVTDQEIRRMLVVAPHDLEAVLVDGHIEARDGRPVRAAGADVADGAVSATWVGVWSDVSRGLDQHLLPTGRYTETRGGRVDAYTGRYWVRGERISYLDDSGFWAFGELLGGVLHHAGFVMTRGAPHENGPTSTFG